MAALTEEQTIIQDQAKAWVSEQAPVQKFREMRDSGTPTKYSPETWQAMVDMGWTGILVPEQYGGSDLGYLTFGLILEEMGRHLTASPLFASAFCGTSALLVAGSETQKSQLLPGIVDGSVIATLAIEEQVRHNPERVSTGAERVSEGFILNGMKRFVLEGQVATTLIVSARTSGGMEDAEGVTLFLVDTARAGVTVDSLATVDSRGYANIQFENVLLHEDEVLGQLDQGAAALQVILDRARAGIAAEMLGTAAQSFDMTLEYLKTREQFGRVIGSFQALGHRAAVLFTAMELARSCVERALSAIDEEDAETATLVSLSKCRMGDFLHEMSKQLIQIHGGIGMTDEFDAGFYLKRARVVESMFGNQAYHRDRYARLLGF